MQCKRLFNIIVTYLIQLAKIELLREAIEEVKIIIPEKVKTECFSKEGIDTLLISTLIREKKIEVKKLHS